VPLDRMSQGFAKTSPLTSARSQKNPQKIFFCFQSSENTLEY
jgi:hypothetical protein